MPRGSGGPSCGYCHAGALYLVTRDVPGSPAAHACKSHVTIAVDKVSEQTGGGSVTVYLLSGGTDLGDGAKGVKEVLEQVRRIGAYSANDPEMARHMEFRLYTAVLALIAQGTANPAGLAATALQSRNYDLDREES